MMMQEQLVLDPGQFADPPDAALFLTNEMGQPTSEQTLAKWRCLGGGPVFQRFGRRIKYRKDRLREFALSRISGEQRSTSEAA
jgi:hypothetical protein